MSYRIYNGTQLLGDVNNKSTGINGLLPATSYQLGVTNYNGNRESSKATINVKTRGIRLIIPTSLTVNSTITLNYQEYSLGLIPIGTEPAGMFGGGNKRNIQAKVISVDNGKSMVELLEPLESSSTVSVGGTNLLKGTSKELKQVTTTNDWVRLADTQVFKDMYPADNFTAKVWIEKPNKDSWLQAWVGGNGLFKGNAIKAGQSGYSEVHGTLNKNITTSANLVLGAGGWCICFTELERIKARKRNYCNRLVASSRRYTVYRRQYTNE
jgi:hypothetical protein